MDATAENTDWTTVSSYPPIAEYAFLSDCEATALVAPGGNIEWMCLPRMDDPSVFASILDRDGGGFRLGPADVMVPAGRRYLAGWAMATELHVLNDPHMERRAAGEDSREALRGTAERLYAQLVLAANNPALPPSWTPRRFARYLRWAWLVEGGAQYFARQVGLYRAAVIRRLRESARPSFPPSRRDAVILGGTIFDLLENERGPEACERLVDGLLPGGPAVTLEDAFDARFRDIEDAWRASLRAMTRPAID